MGKVDIKNFLTTVHGLNVVKVHTINYEGKRKRRGLNASKKPDFKKAYVFVDDSMDPISWQGSSPSEAKKAAEVKAAKEAKDNKEAQEKPKEDTVAEEATTETKDDKSKDKKDYNKGGAKRFK
eukprot:TRINITY_DN11898_c0_g1_i2.p2 TRINITY_DN11898_c0_g1~~TRINITY_DN11898_c0_g1_i2.p2  ORF type:complete len:123 (-),score=46.84 TRINITY_DN11898_c0_g1_i2:46-414(-)